MTEISLHIISKALADLLIGLFPGAAVYDNPQQQKTALPAWFINFMPGSGVNKEIGNRYMRTLRVDLVNLEDYNLPDLYDRYKHAAEVLDQSLEFFSFTGSDGNVYMLHAHDRQWRMDLSAMHYEFRLDLRVSLDLPPDTAMQTIDSLTQTIKEEE
jgi:hypothetical protein